MIIPGGIGGGRGHVYIVMLRRPELAGLNDLVAEDGETGHRVGFGRSTRIRYFLNEDVLYLNGQVLSS